MIKVAFTTPACPSWSVAQVVEAARQYGDDGVELRLIDGDVIDPGEGEVPVAASLSALRRCGYARSIAVEWEKKWHPEIAEPEVALPQHAPLAALVDTGVSVRRA